MQNLWLVMLYALHQSRSNSSLYLFSRFEEEMKSNEINFIHQDVSPEMKEAIMGPFEESDGPVIEFDDSFTIMAHILHKSGIFRSVTEARKNGWDKPIEPGYTHLQIGKKKLNIYILNKFDESLDE